MASGESWWKKPAADNASVTEKAAAAEAEKAAAAEMASSRKAMAEPESAAEPEARPRAGAEISGTLEEDLDGSRSLGEVIDQALGDYDAKLAQLREQVEERRAELAEMEQEVVDLEKEQAKAFKDLLSSNKHIKKMLAPKPKRKPSSRRKKTSQAQADE
jgi:predicted lipid-binding transport protein (Tim44 family)